jgi:hypothetical protein
MIGDSDVSRIWGEVRVGRFGGTVNWLARINSITDDYVAAVRRTENQIYEVDERARAAILTMSERAWELVGEAETAEERSTREVREERDRLLREAAVRQRAEAERRTAARQSGEYYVMPTDWTEEDQARSEGYGPPKSWLT